MDRERAQLFMIKKPRRDWRQISRLASLARNDDVLLEEGERTAAAEPPLFALFFSRILVIPNPQGEESPFLSKGLPSLAPTGGIFARRAFISIEIYVIYHTKTSLEVSHCSMLNMVFAPFRDAVANYFILRMERSGMRGYLYSPPSVTLHEISFVKPFARLRGKKSVASRDFWRRKHCVFTNI